MTQYALSLKQPWAALLVHGLKTVEVRRWPTARRGRVLIHAAKFSDERPAAWDLVPEHLREEARVVGGIIGAILTGVFARAAINPASGNTPAKMGLIDGNPGQVLTQCYGVAWTLVYCAVTLAVFAKALAGRALFPA